uniref:Mitochondrial carrier protein n=1 Tax=Aplanochytrium stocchinoi TaxID=215587 RepID=A0A6S8D7U5_9STRA|mmetsp:Transcript_1162/g.1730  ORF Transcript_1162/g.1730 Transcript_1162/m.1730 type:complete len:338 (+) Transcript_1162:60-1073(+)
MGEKTGKADAEAANRVTLARQLSRRHMLKEGMQDNLEAESKPKATDKNGGKTKLAGWKHFVAGATAGACEVLATMPLDTVKTQMQINPGKYKNPVHAISTIYTQNGFRALYFGMPAFLVQTSGKAAIRFTAYAKAKEALIIMLGEEAVGSNQTASNLACGLMAGAAEAAVWTTPTERLKVLKQASIGQNSKPMGTFGAARVLVAEGGVSSLFVGLVPTVIRQASSVGIRFMLYNPVKDIINNVNGGDEGGTLTYMAAGGTVGGLSVAINNPVDVVKNIAQSGKGQGKGTLGIAAMVYSENGIAGFFRGLSARVPRVFCGQAVTFAAYEQMAKILLPL